VVDARRYVVRRSALLRQPTVGHTANRRRVRQWRLGLRTLSPTYRCSVLTTCDIEVATMFEHIFPRQFDNTYRGHWLGIWLLGLIAIMKGLQGTVSVFDTRNVLINADGIPLDSYGADGIATVIALTALLGFCLLVIALQSVVVLIRYRSMVPLMFLVQLVVQTGGRVLHLVNPISRSSETSMGYAGHPIGFYVNLAILAATLIGFALSLRNKPS
jgi:hypothetical protein